MSDAFLSRPSARALALAAGVFALALAGAAGAQENPWRSGAITIENGAGTTVIDRSVTGRPGAWQGSSTITGPNGGVSTREWRRGFDAGAGTWRRDSVFTGPNGGQRRVQDEVRRVGPGEFQRNRTITGPRGFARQRTTRWRRIR